MMKGLLSAVFLLLLGFCSADRSDSCPESEMIHCRVYDRCTRIRYICDGDNDCGDHSDEQSTLCEVWQQSDCERGRAKCHRYGSADCVTMTRYCSLTDPPCLGDVDPRICQMLRDETLQDIDSMLLREDDTVQSVQVETQLDKVVALGLEFEAQVEGTIKHEGCPLMYTSIADTCISVFFLGNTTWGEAREFCKTINGDLLTLDRDFSFYAKLIKHLRTQQMTADFWVGGSRYNDTSEWTWITDTPMDLDAPLWSIRAEERCLTRTVNSLVNNGTRLANQGRCYQYSQAPSDPPLGQCAALTYEKYYYMTDEDCLGRKAPLCILDEK